jgi:hypothetical protein
MQQYLTNQNKVLANVVSKLWQPSTAYSVGDRIFSPNMSPGVVAEVTSAGTSGSVEPSWGTVGNNINDNTVTWTMIKYATTANAQPLNSLLTAFSGLSASSGKVPYFTGNNTMSTTSISDFAKTFLDDSDAATLRQTIGATAENCGGIIAASLTTNGYVKFANGLIIQWFSGDFIPTTNMNSDDEYTVIVPKCISTNTDFLKQIVFSSSMYDTEDINHNSGKPNTPIMDFFIHCGGILVFDNNGNFIPNGDINKSKICIYSKRLFETSNEKDIYCKIYLISI